MGKMCCCRFRSFTVGLSNLRTCNDLQAPSVNDRQGSFGLRPAIAHPISLVVSCVLLRFIQLHAVNQGIQATNQELDTQEHH